VSALDRDETYRAIGSDRDGRHTMGKLIVTRPRLAPGEDLECSFDIIIDGMLGTSIGLGETIDIELPTGPHQVSARVNLAGSQPVVVECAPGETHRLVEFAPGETHRLAVGPDMGATHFLRCFIMMAFLSLLGLSVWINDDTISLLSHGLRGGTRSFRSPWQLTLLPLVAFLVFLPPLILQCSTRYVSILLIELPRPDLTDEQVAKLLRAHSFRLRFTIRLMMNVVALVALAFWASFELFRDSSASVFRLHAGFHADQEAMHRKFAQRRIESGIEMEKKGFGRGHFAKEAAKWAARADYHAAMKRKYEQAVARGALSVEHDPPPPP
jgi:hypothetical protein